jgi:hypothetical protein
MFAMFPALLMLGFTVTGSALLKDEVSFHTEEFSFMGFA